MKVGDLVKWIGGSHYLHRSDRAFLISEILDDGCIPSGQWFRLLDREGLVGAEDIEVISESR